MTKELGVYTRYGRLGASSRLRYFSYCDAFESAGFAPRFNAFFSDAYLERLYAGRGKSRLLAAGALLRRLAAAARLPERLLIEYELLPELSYGVESRFLRGRRYVLNFDDDVWLKYEGRGSLAEKYDLLIAGASGVVCANDLLVEKALKRNPNVIKIPTAVDLNGFPAQVQKFPRFTVAWIGTPVTYRYLELHAEALKSMSLAVDFELLVIAKAALEEQAIPGVRMRFVDWSAEEEGELLARCHAGIMPLPAGDAFAAGKSAFKLIQYLAAGLPAIASPVGENRRVLRPGETGFFAETPEEWTDALIRLKDDGMRGRFSANARRLAFDYSIQKYGPVYAEFLQSALK
ncbi:MAG: glycosyltransferase family 4 protein [Lentisphaeria bacterium]|nr:glycosyltransferase family 4 protein [Lentisphaeria bacterium]